MRGAAGVYFDLRTFLRLTAHQLRRARGAGPFLLAGWQILSLPIVRGALLLEDAFCPAVRRTPVRAPVFVVGNPRSGTSRLLSLLAADSANACFSTWELALPSPWLRAGIPRALHDRAARFLDRHFAGVRHIHPVALDGPEEDELLFLLLGNSGLYQILFPHGPELDSLALARFWEWPFRKRERFLSFLHGCVQRLLRSRGAERWISKSPHFTGKIDDLLRWYPDARFVYCVRSPLAAVPSALSMARAFWAASLGGRPPPVDALAALYRTLIGLYARAEESAGRIPPANLSVLHYDDLVARPSVAVRSIYARFEFPISDDFARRLEAADREQQRYRSRHVYDLAEFELSEEELRRDLGFVFDRHFATGQGLGDWA